MSSPVARERRPAPMAAGNGLHGCPMPPLSASSIEAYTRTVNAIPVLSAEREKILAAKACLEQDRAAAQALVLSNLRFVIFIARGYAGYGLPLCDLIQEGNIGLLKALKRFDPAVGVRLVSFAVHWIKAQIHEYILRNWRIVKLGTTRAQRRLFFNLRKNRERIGWINQSEAEAIAAQLRVKPEEVLEMDARMLADMSVGSSMSAQRGCLPESLIEDPVDAIEALEERQWADHGRAGIRKGLEQLDPRSRDIIERRWLCDGEPAGLEELGAKYRVSAERIRQIQNGAIRRLRQYLEPPLDSVPA